ncbi:MAG: hypothetical protein CL565_06395 [Alphaproteobacteria bacterium]|nr:hypothetical protein [Alphaproteobacteria bacterium]
MTLSLEKEAKARIASFLPQAICKALKSYHDFMGQDVSIEDAKSFGAHHTAAKVAIAHVELLIKLCKASDLSGEINNKDEKKRLVEVTAQAEAELAQYKSRQEVWEEEGEHEGDL